MSHRSKLAKSLFPALLLGSSTGLIWGADDAPVPFKPAEPTTAQEVYGETIRSTPHRTPQEELSGFHVPEGFVVELIAAEPTIAKPMNLAFDKSGRLWVTQSTQYPFPAKADEKGTDAVVILEDKDKDGSFESSHVFADDLNIPIGLLPYGDGALCFSIPNILYLQDTDHDGVCDKREVLIGPFDTTRDTHGMINSMRMGPDGWVYACHGFNNQSKVAGKDGHTISMNSGNVFRFRPDGSRVELYTQGQVNPFGMSRDRWGFWYAADCHSKPISQLIRGGCYPSFGRPDDGLGFVPPMMDHLHGSTAIAGLEHSMNSRFPMSFEDNFFTGNVMTCRINRDLIEYHGATAKGVEKPDLLTSDDSWFRPVDLQFGPDGNLYVADFYNKIIGHYEVPLNHPDRDRTSGRIWRIRWVSGGDTIEPSQPFATTVSENKGNDKLEQILRAALSTRVGVENLDESQLLAFAESLDLGKDAMIFQMIVDQLAGVGSAENQLPAKEVLPRLERNAAWLIQQTTRIDSSNDPVLWQTVLIALRDTVTELRTKDAARFEKWVTSTSQKLTANDAKGDSAFAIDQPRVRALTRVLLSLKDSVSVVGVLSLAEKQVALPNPTENQSRVLQETIQILAEVAGDSEMDRLVAIMEKTSTDPTMFADQLLNIARRQSQQRGKVLESLIHRGQKILGDLTSRWISEAEKAKSDANFSLTSWSGAAKKGDDRRDWNTEKRERAAVEGVAKSATQFFSSLTLGEAYTGSWNTTPFAAPKELTFWIVGHNGLPAEPEHQKNYVSLMRLDSLGAVVEELHRAYPPRSDIAQLVTWDLSNVAGQDVQIRVIDGDAGNAFAWLGFGDSNQLGLNPSSLRNQWQRIVAYIEVFGWPTNAEALADVKRIGNSSLADWPMRLRLNKYQYHASDAHLFDLIDFATERNWNDLVASTGILDKPLSDWDWSVLDTDKRFAFAKAMCERCSFKEQEQLVLRLSKHRASLPLITILSEKGTISRDSLRVLPKSWWEGLPKEGTAALLAMRPEPESASARLAVVERKSTHMEGIKPDLEVGAKMFTERCAICHKIGEQGKVIGPQLDGAGTRGIARLTEDILWPDRNVDEAFRMTMLILDGGESANGLVSDRTEDSLVITDQTGKQRRILLSEIEQEKESKLSLMPGNFEEVMSDEELASLIGYLKSIATKK